MGTKVFSSAVNFEALTPSDSALVSCKALYIGGSGNVAIKAGPGDTAVVFKNVPDGSWLPVQLREGLVMSTATTATDIIQADW